MRVSSPSTTCSGKPISGTARSKRGSIRDSCSTTSTRIAISPSVLVARISLPTAGAGRSSSEPTIPSIIAPTAASSRPDCGTPAMLRASWSQMEAKSMVTI